VSISSSLAGAPLDVTRRSRRWSVRELACSPADAMPTGELATLNARRQESHRAHRVA
jgi:hypothetical protein